MIIDKARFILQAHKLHIFPDIGTRSVLAVDMSPSPMSWQGVDALEQAKMVDSGHLNEGAVPAVMKHCSLQLCRILERDKPFEHQAAQSRRAHQAPISPFS